MNIAAAISGAHLFGIVLKHGEMMHVNQDKHFVMQRALLTCRGVRISELYCTWYIWLTGDEALKPRAPRCVWLVELDPNLPQPRARFTLSTGRIGVANWVSFHLGNV